MSSGSTETRERILAATWRLMEERRGKGVRLEDVARAAGISRQAVYLHFGSRTDLLVATARYADQTRGLWERIQPYRAAKTGLEKLEQFIIFWGHYLPEIHGLARALLDARATDEAAATAWDDRMADVRTGCQRVISALEHDGQLAPGWEITPAVDLLWSFLAVPVWEDLTFGCGWTTEQYIRWMLTMARHTFVQETPS